MSTNADSTSLGSPGTPAGQFAASNCSAPIEGRDKVSTTGREPSRRKKGRGKGNSELERQLLRERTQREIDQIVADHHAELPRNRAQSIGAVYARYSTRHQDSAADQVRAILADATKLGIHVPLDLVFFDLAVRGFKKSRSGLDAMESALKARKAQALLLFSTSRLFRKQYRTLEFVDRVHKGWSIRCIFTKSGVDTDDKQRWETILATQSMIDQFVVTMYVDNIRSAQEGLLEKRMVFGTISYGYAGETIKDSFTARGKPRRRLVIDEAAADVVRQIFEWYVNQSLPITEIIRRLNDMPDIPLSPRSTNGEWTHLSVKNILVNTRYRGLWRYGATESCYVPDGDYVRQRMRAEPLKEVSIEELRIVPDTLWYAAQERLKRDRGSRGRKPKDGNYKSRPKLLNGLFWCPEHDCQLYVGGGYGTLMFCPSCRRTSVEKRPLFSLLNRRVAVELICRKVGELIRSDSSLVDQIMEACRHEADLRQQPDASRVAQLRAQDERLKRAIEFGLRNPGDSEEDLRHTQQLLSDQRAERNAIHVELQRLLALQQQEVRLPTREEVKKQLENLDEILTAAALNREADPEEIAMVHAILTQVTGGRIELYQQGERKTHQGWLQGRFRPKVVELMVDRLAVGLTHSTEETPEIAIDFKSPDPWEKDAEIAWSLYHQGMMNAEIALEIGCGRARAGKLIRRAAEKRGVEIPDGRTRRSSLEKKQLEMPRYQQIADRAVELWNESDLLIDEIASELRVDRNTITHAVAYWHKSRGLPIPDGRTRRKRLSVKSSKDREGKSRAT